MSGTITHQEFGRVTDAAANAASTDRIMAFDVSTGLAVGFTPDQIQGGASTVDGPASSTNNAIARWDATTGKILQDSTVLIDDSDNISGVGTFSSGIQTSTGLNVISATDAITAFAGGGQGSAVALTSQINSITTSATAGDSVALPTSIAGHSVQVSNIGAAYADVFPISGDLIDELSVNIAVSLAPGQSIIFTCSVAGSWKSTPQEALGAKYTTGTTTTTFAAGELTGGDFVTYNNTQGTPGSIATRTATLMFTDDPFSRVAGAYRLRIINNQGTGTLTVTAGTGVTLTGTMTIAVNTFRDFNVTYTSATALVIQSITDAPLAVCFCREVHPVLVWKLGSASEPLDVKI